jgi:myo-inositol-1(or 4)-monophosphatase
MAGTSPCFHELHVARRAAAAAGQVLRVQFGNAAVSEKQSNNLVTQADLDAEQAVTELLLAEFPRHSLLREEGGDLGDRDATHLWVIDPLDGTNNYAHGMPHFSVSIAYLIDGEPQAGVVYDPLRHEMYTALRGVGAWLNDRPIVVSTRATINQSLITTGFYYDRGAVMERTLQSIHALFTRNVRGIRRTGGAALDLAYVAAGRFEGFFEYRLAPWDFAAGWLLVQEAGGLCFDRFGDPLALPARSIIAANRMVAQELLDVVRWRDAP